ncbi:DMT family transporter [Rickettsiella endosymbiont of Litargus connexus]|jgi:quaternary ammonium compound-resistance protein SugE|uniref:DMT family transporter n=1 Tax=Rickettsiella endosymbiont of Litargus connexus TaxID=3066237 RepID=UPI0027EC9014|nr:multidrug efflux SMR transporter [Candidatus Rickettsiella isopodorum]MDD5161419.1 multidrug efflux SMR transporter [Candidatus Rickettsiella isopodorum]MDQ5899108.1 quaternary ammonium compound-resistance protein SugE [Pseudomonadota bacterium]
MNPWLILVVAGLFEVGFTTCMKLSEGFTQIKYTLGFIFFSILSLFLLNKAILQIPLGTAYAVWTGIGAFGTAVIGMLFFKDPLSLLRVLFLTLLIGSILGLKLVSSR